MTYRTHALVKAEQEKEIIGGGYITRHVHVSAHACRPPGFWPRCWYRIRDSDIWQCRICEYDHKWCKPEHELFGEWRKL